MIWIGFLFCLAVILFAGTKLARYGDIIAEKTGLGGIWIGMILLAAITSVPEAATSISSVSLVHSADLAVGTLFGSNLFNLAILAFLDVSYPVIPILSVVSRRHSILGFGVVLLTVVAGIGILFGGALSGVTIGWIGLASIVLVIAYFLVIRRMAKLEREDSTPVETKNQYDAYSLKKVWLKFALASAAVIGAGVLIAFIGDEIASVTGWGTSFVGSLFLAIGTSAPELVVTFAALRIGSVDMAIADILGSNMFNIAIIFLADIFYTDGAVLSDASDVHLITAFSGIIMAALVLLGLRYRRQKKSFGSFSWYSPIMIAIYLFGFYFLFMTGVG